MGGKPTLYHMPVSGIRAKVKVGKGSHMTSVRGSLKKAVLVAGKVLQGAGVLKVWIQPGKGAGKRI